MSRPDEGLIHTWLDGECSADEAAEIERLVATDPAWAAAVAEARGLIAASSRIVSALDAVPARVVPEGSKAAPGVEKIAPASPEVPVREGFRVRTWMKMAAGVVLVAGTAYAIGGTTREVFTSPPAVASEKAPAAQAPETEAPASEPPAPVVAPAPLRVADAAGAPAVNRERSVAKAAPVAAPAASAPAPAPATRITAENAPTPATPPTATSAAGQAGGAAPAEDRAARMGAMARRLESNALSQVVTTGTRGAVPEKILDSPNSIAAVMRLDGCWSITAPDSLRTLLRSPAYTRGATDSLVVEFVLGSTRFVTVRQDGDALRGAITAKRVECPRP